MHSRARPGDLPRAVRRAGVLGRLPPPGRARQGGDGDRPALRGTGCDRSRRRLGRDRVHRLRDRLPDRSARAWINSRKAAACVRGLLHDEVTSFDGRWFTHARARATNRDRCRPSCRSGSAVAASGAHCASPPATPTVGTCRSCPPRRSAASAPCSTTTAPHVGRDPAEIRCAVNVGLAWTEESLQHQFGAISRLRPPRSARWFGLRGRRPHRRIRRRRRRPGQPRAARAVRSRRAGALRRRRGARLTADSAYLPSSLCFCSWNSSSVSVPRSRSASSRSSCTVTSCGGASTLPAAPAAAPAAATWP